MDESIDDEAPPTHRSEYSSSDGPSDVDTDSSIGSSSDEESEEEVLDMKLCKELHCTNCGANHRNPALGDTYRNCHFCNKFLREPKDLVRPYHSIRPRGQLRIFAASYGHPRDARRAVEVSGILQKLINTRFGGNELYLDEEDSLINLFGDPCERVKKVFRIRYEMSERRAERMMIEREPGFLGEKLHLKLVGRQPKLRLYSGTYGHPRGPIRGRGAFDVTEMLQARIDMNGGDYLEISCDERLSTVFGDPCVGTTKELNLHYEIVGERGEVRQLEARGKLMQDLHLSSTPTCSPMLLIVEATFGLNQEQIDDMAADIQKQLGRLYLTISRKKSGLAVKKEDNERTRLIPFLESELAKLRVQQPCAFDVHFDMQELVDREGAGIGFKLSANDDLCALFGDPCPGFSKLLVVTYEIQPLDDCGDANEVTRTGYRKNFIIPKKGTMTARVDPNGHLMSEFAMIATKVLPVLQIQKAIFGHPKNFAKSFDVTDTVRTMVDKEGGYQLNISRHTDIAKIFKDPCRGVRKLFRVNYECLAIAGRLRLPEIRDRLVGSLRLGYPGKNTANMI